MTLSAGLATKAYRSASKYLSTRDQESEVFRYVARGLSGARQAGPIAQVRALADNRRLWMAVSDVMRDPGNAFPDSLKASILSVSLTVQRVMDEETPDIDFLISINEGIAAGLADQK